MSHKVTYNSEIKDLATAKQALTRHGITFREQGSQLHLLSGDYRESVIDTRTGRITSGDSDRVRYDGSKIGLLRQYYAEAMILDECNRDGIQIESHGQIQLQGQQVIEIVCLRA
jgi:hypothetical protein